jgi:hypothetical protein
MTTIDELNQARTPYIDTDNVLIGYGAPPEPMFRGSLLDVHNYSASKLRRNLQPNPGFQGDLLGSTVVPSSGGSLVPYWGIWNGTNQPCTVSVIPGMITGTRALRFSWAVAPTTGVVDIFTSIASNWNTVFPQSGRLTGFSFYFRSTNSPVFQVLFEQWYGPGGGGDVSRQTDAAA